MRQRHTTSNDDDDPRETTTRDSLRSMTSSKKAGEIIMTNLRSSPKIQLSLLLWILGLVWMFLAPAPGNLSPETVERYDAFVTKALTVPGYDQSYRDVLSSQAQVEARRAELSMGEWILSGLALSSENTRLSSAREALARDQLVLDQLEMEKDQWMARARAEVGIWSVYGVEEMRFRFWSAFNRGKVFAQRQTFWQMLWSVLDSREDNLLGLVLQWLLTALVNFTLSLTGAFFYFLWSVLELISSFGPSLTSGLAFLLLAGTAGASVVVSYLLGLYLMAISSVYVMGNVLMTQARLQGRDGPRRPNIQ